MKSNRFNWSTLWRRARLVVAAFVCTFVLFSQALPAYSANPNPSAPTSSPTKGEDNLLGIERESQKVIRSYPAATNQKDTQARTNPGLNAVQGTADADKQKRPENSQAVSIEDKIENVLEGAVGN
ncbi:MAG: low temperature-induced protein [Kastovskya adunca ATA6-11-RM4]|jgi:hypothetical protein|nr:low temperature-induced protein [Kastovskya adunca ATA6-11-RM4]